jgi:hypothetical protein
MAMSKIKKCRYDHGPHKNATCTNFSVSGNTEGAVKEYLQKKHRGKEIVVKEITWA